MPRIIAKFGYMKPSNKTKSQYLEYIARRDGVIINMQKNFNKPTTANQLQLINKLLHKYPNSRGSPEYETYNQNPCLGTATEFITYLEESFFNELSHNANYLEYIAKRPRVVKEKTHGLFSDSDDILDLESLKKDIDNHNGYIWTLIISLKREDAHRLNYESLDRWKNLIRSKKNDLSTNLRISPENFVWFGAFHNEAHHPHVHIMMLSKDGKQGYLNKQGIDNIRSSFAKEIFKHDLYNIYNKQTIYRDELKTASELHIKATIQEITKSMIPSSYLDIKLVELAHDLKEVKGKLVYGYLPKSIKKNVDIIVDLISKDSTIQELFDLWYLQRQEVLFTYTDKKEEIRNLSDLKEFRPVKNMVLKLAQEIDTDKITHLLNFDKPVFEDVPTINIVDQSPNIINTDLEEIEMIDSPLPIHENSMNEPQVDKQSFPSLKLLYQISRMFESQMIDNAKNYHIDKEIYKNIKRKKMALGQHKDD